MTQRFYFDTSVFGGMFDTEFEEESTLLFEKVKLGQIKCVYSDLTESELANAPLRVQEFFININESDKQLIYITAEALTLAQRYIDDKVVGPTSLSSIYRRSHFK